MRVLHGGRNMVFKSRDVRYNDKGNWQRLYLFVGSLHDLSRNMEPFLSLGLGALVGCSAVGRWPVTTAVATTGVEFT